jgi:hypothetical protein
VAPLVPVARHDLEADLQGQAAPHDRVADRQDLEAHLARPARPDRSMTLF